MNQILVLAVSVPWTLFAPVEAQQHETHPAVAESAALAPGDPAPPLSLDALLQAPDQAKATWDSLRGRVVVLEF